MEGETQASEELANAAEGEGLGECIAEEGLGHGGRLETPVGSFLNEPLLLGGGQISRVSAIREVIESVESFF